MVQRTDLGQEPGVAAGPGDAAQAERRVEGSPWSRRSSASGNSDPGVPSEPAVE